jgi:beta-lactamase superfamily II metal-dependent hydrolase
VAFGHYLDSLGLNNSTIDVVVLTHAHLDHASGLRELFRTSRNIRVRYFFENKDLSATVTLSRLRDSILARMDRDSLIYRDTDDPCADGSALCTIEMAGGARLHVMKPLPNASKQNDRSAPLKLIGPDSASFTMWLAGDAEHSALRWFERAGYPANPGMVVNIAKANHHGSCNGVTARYLALIRPDWLVASLGGNNGYGHMHSQAKSIYRRAKIPWYRTDRNGNVTIRAGGMRGSGYTITPDRQGETLTGRIDRASRGCGGR